MSCSPHWGRLLTQHSLARPKLRPLCATRVATLTRVDTRCIAVGRDAGHVPRATSRSRLRSKMSCRNGPAAGQGLPRRQRCQDRAMAAARRLVNKSCVRARSEKARWRRSDDLLTNRLTAARAISWRRGNPCPAAGRFGFLGHFWKEDATSGSREARDQRRDRQRCSGYRLGRA
jgi:hypothetical protein